MPAITPADLRARLFIYADDSMQGRRSGTPGGIKATDYLAAEARRLGLEPGGENGSYFQAIPLTQRTLDPESGIAVAGTRLEAWDDLIPRDQGRGARDVNGAQAVYGGRWSEAGDELIPAGDAAGKLVVITVAPAADGTPAGTVNRAVVTARFGSAAGIVVATADAIGPSERLELQEPGAQLAAGHSSIAAPDTPTFMYATSRAAEALLGRPAASLEPGAAGPTVEGAIRFVDSPTPEPARNVVAILRGSDPALRRQFVAIGAHNDHDGIAPETLEHDSLRAFNLVMRPEGAGSTPGEPTAEQSARIRTILDSLRRERGPRPDSVLNGADDDGSGSVAMLEIAELFARGTEKPRRSVLFVWHAAEELGLLGADHYTRQPTVPRDSIVAALNIDMIGRGGASDLEKGGPGYLQLIGSRRLSTQLGDLVERVNQEGKHGFTFDYGYDADGHPDNYYCRSDHAMYARYGIPVTFFTTGGHPDYHQLTDEPQYIDYEKLARVTGLIGAVALETANLDR
ncbi:MAG: M28 family peptidase, partial [Gemmatimonadales bacterium]|nr:M28 family peptidase [Gemmatimonadales bacterium]